jgi:hypothetical protein
MKKVKYWAYKQSETISLLFDMNKKAQNIFQE